MTRPKRPTHSARAFAAAAGKKGDGTAYEVCLFIAGTTPHSTAALANVVAICEERLKGRCDLVVVDVYQEPARARADQIVAIPTLLKKRPFPVKRLIGELSDRVGVLSGLSLPLDPIAGHED